MPKKIKISVEELKEFYEKKELSTFKIAKKFSCCQATIWKLIKKYKIKARPPGVKRVNITKEELEELYSNKKFSTWKIEKLLKIPRGTIHRKLKEFDIKRRDRAESHIFYQRKDFSGDNKEKAYLIGFRLGDLGVRKIYSSSKTICVASGSTKKSQINLIQKLFEGYGRIWIKKKNNKINIQILLNLSFDFLLDKKASEWIFKDKDCFFSFLAGFSDAEGSMKIYKSRAQYSLGNYDLALLKKIRKNLIKHEIYCNKIITDNRKGKKNSEGYVYKNNYSSIRIHKKDNLSKLFVELSKYLKHEDKVKDLNIAINNIKERSK